MLDVTVTGPAQQPGRHTQDGEGRLMAKRELAAALDRARLELELSSLTCSVRCSVTMTVT
jgi:hypothetical protein